MSLISRLIYTVPVIVEWLSFQVSKPTFQSKWLAVVNPGRNTFSRVICRWCSAMLFLLSPFLVALLCSVSSCGKLFVSKPIATLRQLPNNVKDKVKQKDARGAAYKIRCCDCPATCVGETGRNLKTRLTEPRGVTS